MRLSVRLSVLSHGVVDISTAKGPVKHHRVFNSRRIQNGWVFEMVVVSTGCTIAVNHTFTFPFTLLDEISWDILVNLWLLVDVEQ